MTPDSATCLSYLPLLLSLLSPPTPTPTHPSPHHHDVLPPPARPSLSYSIPPCHQLQITVFVYSTLPHPHLPTCISPFCFVLLRTKFSVPLKGLVGKNAAKLNVVSLFCTFGCGGVLVQMLVPEQELKRGREEEEGGGERERERERQRQSRDRDRETDKDRERRKGRFALLL